MGASLSLAASIALSAASTQALGTPGRGGSTTQANLAQGQAGWLLSSDPSDLTSDAQQDTTGQQGVQERNENGPFTLGSRVDSGDVAQANVALGSADSQATTAQSDNTGDASVDQSTTQTLIGQDSKQLGNESQPVVVWSQVDSGNVAQANVERGSASSGSATQQAAEQPSLPDLPPLVVSDPGGGALSAAVGGGRLSTSPSQVAGNVAGSLGNGSGANGAPEVAGASNPVSAEGTLAAAHDLTAQLQADQGQPPAAGTASPGDPTSSTSQTASGQVGTVQVNVNDPVTVLSRVQSGDVQQANVASGRASNQSQTSQADPNDPTQTTTGQDTAAQVNVNAPVTVLSRVQSGSVRQANIASGEASNSSETAQESSGGDLVSDGSSSLTSGSVSSTTDQSATGQTGVAQVNVNAPVTVLSRVQSGDVAQANVALGRASNQSQTDQQGSSSPPA